MRPVIAPCCGHDEYLIFIPSSTDAKMDPSKLHTFPISGFNRPSMLCNINSICSFALCKTKSHTTYFLSNMLLFVNFQFRFDTIWFWICHWCLLLLTRFCHLWRHARISIKGYGGNCTIYSTIMDHMYTIICIKLKNKIVFINETWNWTGLSRTTCHPIIWPDYHQTQKIDALKHQKERKFYLKLKPILNKIIRRCLRTRD